MIDEKLDPTGKMTPRKLQAMQYLLKKYPRKPTKKDLEFINREKNLDTMAQDIDDLFPIKEDDWNPKPLMTQSPHNNICFI